jgi:hypothetical protein
MVKQLMTKHPIASVHDEMNLGPVARLRRKPALEVRASIKPNRVLAWTASAHSRGQP